MVKEKKGFFPETLKLFFKIVCLKTIIPARALILKRTFILVITVILVRTLMEAERTLGGRCH